MSLIDLYQDHNISFQTEDHKHCRPGWVNTSCPFCTGNPGLHLGFNTNTGAFYCWRCGWHPAPQVICRLLNISNSAAKNLINKYEIGKAFKLPEQNKKIQFKPFRMPSNCYELSSPYCKGHRKYLAQRGFNPTKLEKEWGLMGTGPMASLDKINYSYRIIIPVFWGGKPVSFQSRAINDEASLRYITCSKTREIIDVKQILYGKQEQWGEVGICVEGVTDVWRFGPSAFAIFGIDYTHQQVIEIKRHFKKVFIVFDDDPQAIIKGDKLVADLLFRGVEARQIIIKGDPGGMGQNAANALISRLLKK